MCVTALLFTFRATFFLSTPVHTVQRTIEEGPRLAVRLLAFATAVLGHDDGCRELALIRYLKERSTTDTADGARKSFCRIVDF